LPGLYFCVVVYPPEKRKKKKIIGRGKKGGGENERAPCPFAIKAHLWPEKGGGKKNRKRKGRPC